MSFPKKKKLKKIGVLKKEVWKVFSEFIRRRFGENPYCFTCGVQKNWKEFHAGHFIHGHSKATFLDERNVHCQCVKCNHFLSGNLIEYTERMRIRHGQDTIDALRELSHQIWKPSRSELEDLIETYKKKLLNLA